MNSHGIPIVNLDMQNHEKTPYFSKPLLENEIKGVSVEHIAISGEQPIVEHSQNGFKSIYLFVKGTGEIIADKSSYEIVPESIFLPNTAEAFSIASAHDSTVHCVKISCKLSAQDQENLTLLPTENTHSPYFAKFSDCQSYSEAIKSPNTVSRTILSNAYIPRVAMGTVHTTGPDKVGAHEHPMLEQLFLGLSGNNCTVYADADKTEFPSFSILHIPLGSRHSVSVEKDEIMYYVWMDFFIDKDGEQWLKTHKVDSDIRPNIDGEPTN